MTSTPRTDTHPTDTEVGALLDQALLPLKAIGEELHRRAVDYVLHGTDPELLTQIAAHNKDADIALAPGIGEIHFRYVPTNSFLRAPLMELGIDVDASTIGSEAWALRDALYLSDGVSPAQWERLGRLLDEARRGNRTGDRNLMPAQVPTWFDALVVDVLRTAGADQPRERGERRDFLSRTRQAWTPERLSAILAAGGVPEAECSQVLLLAYLADPVEARYHWVPWPSTLPGASTWLAEHVEQISRALLGCLAAPSRRRLLKMVERDPALTRACIVVLLALLSTDSSKRVRVEAVAFLTGLEPEERDAALAPVLATVPASRAAEVVEHLAVAPRGRAALEAAVAANPRLAPVVEQCLARHEAVTARPEPEPLVVPPMVPLEEGPSAAPAKTELRAALNRIVERHTGSDSAAAQDRLAVARRITDADLDDLIAAADGRSDEPGTLQDHYGLHAVAEFAPSLTLAHLLRLERLKSRPALIWAARHRLDPGVDPRALEDLMNRLGIDTVKDPRVAQDLADLAWGFTDPQVSWPWWAEHVDVLRHHLEHVQDLPRAAEILTAFPSLPDEVVSDLARMVVGSSKAKRDHAEALLSTHPIARTLAEQALADRSAEVRASAAAWLSNLADPAAVPALRTALATEKREVVRAAMLSALRACGDDLADLLAPQTLADEAARGLRAKVPASLDWFGWEALPAVRWAGGGPVDPQVIRWWVVLADKMKNPDGRGLIGLYLSLLDPSDARLLAAHVVRAWVAQDTRHPDHADSLAYAEAEGSLTWQRTQDWVAQLRAEPEPHPWLPVAEQEAAVPVEEQVARAYAKHQATYLGSAIADKGLVAFAVAMDGGELAELVRGYMRGNPGRRAQFDALVHALYANGSHEALQVLLSVARRHRMEALQATAARLAADVAAERGWSAEELADRTIPTAGFSDDGLLRLSYGSREFVGRLTPEFGVVLTDSDGRMRKSLPAARVGEDPEVVKAAKKQLTSARKEAKAVLTLQRERLYEAMCTRRAWSAPDWRGLLVNHPLVRHLVTRLVWVATPADGGRGVTFRPTEDGELIGVDDRAVGLDDDATVTVAHGTLMSSGERDDWRSHLADYEVTPLFDQLSAAVPQGAQGATELTEFRGHMTDSLSVRGEATKRGYIRGAVEDGGWFREYVKAFASQGLTAVLTFTGSFVPEESITCAIKTLSFRRRSTSLPLDQVPDVLLAECYADYAALGALGPYDPNWREASTF